MDPRTDAGDEALAALHRRAFEAIPWVVNGTASEAQRRQVQQHVEACADCRAELDRQHALQSAMTQPLPVSTDVETGLQRLWQRIDQAQDEAAAVPAGAARRAPQRGRWLVPGLMAAVIVEAIGLSVLGGGAYRTYSTYSDAPVPAAQAAAIRIVARPQMNLGDLQRVLLDLELEIVSGPNQAGAYALAPRVQPVRPAPARDEQIARLRATPGLLLVEPVAASNAR